MSLGALLRGPIADWGHQKKSQRQHKYNKSSVEKDIGLGERVATFIASQYGEERSAMMLATVATRAQAKI